MLARLRSLASMIATQFGLTWDIADPAKTLEGTTPQSFPPARTVCYKKFPTKKFVGGKMAILRLLN